MLTFGAQKGDPGKSVPRRVPAPRGFHYPFFFVIPFDSFWLSGDLKDSGLGQAASLGSQSARPKSLRKCLRIWRRWPLAGLLPHRGAYFFLFSYLFLSFPFGFPGISRPRCPRRLLARREAFLFLFYLFIPSVSFYFLQIPTIPFDFRCINSEKGGLGVCSMPMPPACGFCS